MSSRLLAVCMCVAQVSIDGCSFQRNTGQSYDGAVGVYDSSEVRWLTT
jgi:hypothetical protein